MSCCGVGIGEQDEKPGLLGVGDPELAPVQLEAVSLVDGRGRHGEGVAARSGFGQGVAGHRAARQAGEVFPLLVIARPTQERVDDQRVLDVDDDRRRRVGARQSLHREHGIEKRAALAAVFLGDGNSHQAHLEKLLQDIFAELSGLVHLADVRPDLVARESVHGIEKELLILVEDAQSLLGHFQA